MNMTATKQQIIDAIGDLPFDFAYVQMAGGVDVYCVQNGWFLESHTGQQFVELTIRMNVNKQPDMIS